MLLNRVRSGTSVSLLLFLFVLLPSLRPLIAQEHSPIDLSGTWRWVHHEDEYEHEPGADPGEYWGLPLNDAARMRADTYRETWVTSSTLLQCRPRAVDYQPLGLDPMQIDKMVDPVNKQLVAYRVSYEKTPGERVIWLDGRDAPSEYAQHTWEGFSSGKFKGDTLEVTTTHIKEGYVRRNGVATSFRATVIEQIALDEPFLTWVVTVIDPDYLTEPLVKSVVYVRAPTLQLPPYPCQPEDEQQPGVTKYKVPHYLWGENPYLTEDAFKYRMPIEGVRGGAETTYPEWRTIGEKLSPPKAEYALKPVYKDDSTRIAEMADHQPKRPSNYEKVEGLHVSGNVYLLAGAGGNIAASIGGDGVIMVDSGASEATDKVLSAIRQAAQTMRPPDRPDSASPFAGTWLATHVFAEPVIRMIINTTAAGDHVGGNANIRKSGMFRPISAGTAVLAYDDVQRRMNDENAPDLAVPTTTYVAQKYTLFRYLNNQAIEVFHMPNAISDGDSAVWFRRSDVIATGDIYNSEMYPPIDPARGGSIEGEIDALNKLVDMCAAEFMAQGGTMIIPGHGWISDVGDLNYYRDMIIIIRDRIQSLIEKGMTLEQVKAAKPTMDYDPEYGRQPGVTTHFVEAVYRSLTEKKTK